MIRARALPPPKKATPWNIEAEIDGHEDAAAVGASEAEAQQDGYGGGGTGGSGSLDAGSGQGGGAGTTDDQGTKKAEAQDEAQHGVTRIHLRNVRAIPIAPNSRRVAFTTDRTGKIRVLVQDSGADTNRRLAVVSASTGTVHQGYVDDVDVTAGMRCVFDIEFEDDFSGTLRLTADAI